MKRIFMILVAVILTASVFAQTPEAMSYQAVIRNSESKLVKNQEVGMQISILQGTADGMAVYVETHKPTTNANGLVTVEIGKGTVVSGDFTAIDWSADKYFIKTETDPTGGTNYTITGTSQLLSVAYALHAKTAESVKGGITESDPVFTAWDKSYNDLKDKPTLSTVATSGSYNDLTDKPIGGFSDAERTKLQDIETGAEVNVNADWNATSGDAQILNKPTIPTKADGSETKLTAGTNVTVSGTGTTANPYVVNATDQSPLHYVGELFGGGIVFWVDHTGKHGLIASLDDLDGGNGVKWGLHGTDVSNCESMTDGKANTAAIIAAGAATGTAAVLCDSYAAGGFNDWYLPSNRELSLLARQDILIDKILDNDGDSNTNGFSQENISPTYSRYWSSSENTDNDAWYFRFYLGYSLNGTKDLTCRVRAVRAF